MEGSQLESRVDSWPEEVALVVAIAAKASTLHILNGRFAETLSLESSEESAGTAEPTSTPGLDEKAPSSPTQSEALGAATNRMAALKRENAQEAATWLARVCAHIGVRLDQLPDALGPDVKLPLPAPSEGQSTSQEQRQWDTVWELVLVSLGLVGTSVPTAKDEPSGSEKGGDHGGGQRDRSNGEVDSEKNLASKLGSKVSSLFSSGPSPSTPASPSSNPPAPDNTATSPPSPTTTPPLNYTALSRSLLVRTLTFLSIPESLLTDVEHTIAQFLFFQLQERNQNSSDSTAARQETDKARDRVGWDSAAKEYRERAAKKGNALKWAATGAGFVLGGVAIGLTGGLAAPAIAAGLGTFGIATFSGAGGAVLIGTLLGLGGGGLAGYRTHRRMKGLEDVRFEPIQDQDAHEFPQIPSLTATIVASGFLLDAEDSVEPWRSYVRSSRADAYALKADPQTFLEAGRSLDKYIQNRLLTMGGVEVVKRTALAAIYAGVALPLTLFQTATTAFDSDFTRCRDKAQKAGVLLAEILQKEVQGKRPVVLIGYGPGASLILSCLEHLHSLSLSSLVYSAVLISLPSSPSRSTWARARSVVAHELVNAWSANDWVLAIAARLYTLSPSIAGIRPVSRVEGITNVDVSDLVTRGHLEIRQKLGLILERVMDKRDEQPSSSFGGGGSTRSAAEAAEEQDQLAEEMATLDVDALACRKGL
ncbi:DUF726-domain-containing protein [Rhodotorula sp. JG-1b]|nr:DUF726-domain-containing protein [Rhodotorula sp. JG-1b]